MSEEQVLEKEEQKKSPLFLILVIVISLLIAAGIAILGRMWYAEYSSEKGEQGVETYYRETSAALVTEQLKDNPVDFEALQKTNSDLYAWIKVPGTRVNYPIAQGNDDSFYLHHDYQKNYLFAGTIYTELCNRKDFSDPITLVYGHNMYKSEGTMFTTLHNFEEQSFFDSHDNFTIYTKGHILTYKIFSVFRYDNRHIMNSFDFEHGDDLENFQKMMLSPRSAVKFVREDTELNEDSKVVILSTCCSGDKSVRLLVCGVLDKDEPTK